MNDTSRVVTLLLLLSLLTVGAFGTLIYKAKKSQIAVQHTIEKSTAVAENPELQDPFSSFTDPVTGLKSSLGTSVSSDGRATTTVLNLNELATPQQMELKDDALATIQ